MVYGTAASSAVILFVECRLKETPSTLFSVVGHAKRWITKEQKKNGKFSTQLDIRLFTSFLYRLIYFHSLCVNKTSEKSSLENQLRIKKLPWADRDCIYSQCLLTFFCAAGAVVCLFSWAQSGWAAVELVTYVIIAIIWRFFAYLTIKMMIMISKPSIATVSSLNTHSR